MNKQFVMSSETVEENKGAVRESQQRTDWGKRMEADRHSFEAERLRRQGRTRDAAVESSRARSALRDARRKA